MAKAPASETHRALARSIVQHLLDESAEAGAPISELGLAQRFGVSRSPVRGALSLLESEGVVQRQPNRRFVVARRPTFQDSAPTMPDEGGEAERLYWRIASDRLAEVLAAQTSEVDLMRRYEASRSLVRKAMTQIMAEGWAEQLPTGSWRFLPLVDGPQSYAESYRFRRAIEPAALLDPGFQLAGATANRIRQEQRFLIETPHLASPRQVFEYNSGFHLALMQASNNRFFSDAAQRVTHLRRIAGYVIALDKSRTHTQSIEHLQILDRVEDGDLAAAARAMARHLKAGQASKDRLLANSRLTIDGLEPSGVRPLLRAS